MTAFESLCQTWGAVLAECPREDGFYRRRIPMAYPWPAHAGIRRPTDVRTLILETEKRLLRGHRLRDETRGYSIEAGEDEAGREGRCSICIIESRQGQGEIFTIFCADILEHWSQHAGSSEAIEALVAQLARWKKFFQRDSGMSREEYVGLYGELSFLEAGLAAGIPAPALLDAWRGMQGTNQDFLFGPAAVEIKAVTGNMIDSVRIANIRQLDGTGLQSLFLCRYAFDLRERAGRTLPQLVAKLRASLAAVSHGQVMSFNERLLDTGFTDASLHELDGFGFELRRLDAFNVCDGFPRLLESALPTGVSEVAYTIHLAAALPFRISEADLWSTGISPHV